MVRDYAPTPPDDDENDVDDAYKEPKPEDDVEVAPSGIDEYEAMLDLGGPTDAPAPDFDARKDDLEWFQEGGKPTIERGKLGDSSVADDPEWLVGDDADPMLKPGKLGTVTYDSGGNPIYPFDPLHAQHKGDVEDDPNLKPEKRDVRYDDDGNETEHNLGDFKDLTPEQLQALLAVIDIVNEGGAAYMHRMPRGPDWYELGGANRNPDSYRVATVTDPPREKDGSERQPQDEKQTEWRDYDIRHLNPFPSGRFTPPPLPSVPHSAQETLPQGIKLPLPPDEPLPPDPSLAPQTIKGNMPRRPTPKPLPPTVGTRTPPGEAREGQNTSPTEDETVKKPGYRVKRKRGWWAFDNFFPDNCPECGRRLYATPWVITEYSARSGKPSKMERSLFCRVPVDKSRSVETAPLPPRDAAQYDLVNPEVARRSHYSFPEYARYRRRRFMKDNYV